MRKAVVVGAGLGGIAAAARLARLGLEVIVLEKRPTPGGRCGHLRLGDFLFDTGPTLYLMPQVFEDTFTALGASASQHLDLMRVDPTYRVHFSDGNSLDLTSDHVALRSRLEALEPGAYGGLLRFMQGAHQCHTGSLERFVSRNFLTVFDQYSPGNLPLLLRLKALTPHYSYVSRCFRDPRLRAAFSFQCMYLGLSPFEAPATYSLLQYSELAEGVWFPRGGLYRVVEALVKVAEGLGVKFGYRAPVQRICVESGRARAVELDSGERIEADVVVVNADLPYAYAELLPDPGPARALERRRYSSSALMFYWGLRGPREPALLHHNVFLAERSYRQSFDRIFRDLTLPEQPSFYLCAATRSDPSLAPQDGDGLLALVPVGRLAPGQDWTALEKRARQAVYGGLQRIGLGDLPNRILAEQTWGPQEYREQLNLHKGAAFGLSHDFRQVGYLRPHNAHRRYRNLYFVGASTHPGTGLPLVLLSARLVVERILQEHGPGP